MSAKKPIFHPSPRGALDSFEAKFSGHSLLKKWLANSRSDGLIDGAGPSSRRAVLNDNASWVWLWLELEGA